MDKPKWGLSRCWLGLVVLMTPILLFCLWRLSDVEQPPLMDAAELNRCIIDITSIPNLPPDRRAVCNKMIFGELAHTPPAQPAR